jgi:hypothetical protein
VVNQYSQLDSLYSQVLDTAKQDHRWNDILKVLQVVITALDPLPIPVIADLLKINQVTVSAALRRLAAVITVPNDKDIDTPVLPFHASFPDFLHTHSRSGTHHILETQAHYYMLRLCLNIFDSTLKRNICELHSNNVCLQDIHPSPSSMIPKALQYACTSWLVHLDCILEFQELDESQVLNFFNTNVLHWIECMALLGKLEDATHLLYRIELSFKVGHL